MIYLFIYFFGGEFQVEGCVFFIFFWSMWKLLLGQMVCSSWGVSSGHRLFTDEAFGNSLEFLKKKNRSILNVYVCTM